MIKKIILIFASMMLLGSCGSSQTQRDSASSKQSKSTQDTILQREVLGITLTTQKDSALINMKSLGYGMDQIDRDIFIYDNTIRYGSELWDMMSFVTYDNKVRKVQFVKLIDNMDTFYEEYDKLSNALKGKYNTLISYEDTCARKSGIHFADSITSVELQLDIIGEQPALTLTYNDIHLENKYNDEIFNEL